MRVESKGHTIWINPKNVVLITPQMSEPKDGPPVTILGTCVIVLDAGINIPVDMPVGAAITELEAATTTVHPGSLRLLKKDE